MCIYVHRQEVQARIVREVTVRYSPTQLAFVGVDATPDIASIAAQTA